MIPILYMGKIKDDVIIIDGGRRTRTLNEFIKNQFYWNCNGKNVYYSDTPKETRNSRIMTNQEREYFDNYKLTVITYIDISEKQARIVFNRLQNSAPMTMADVVNSYESNLIDFLRDTVRPTLLGGREDYKHIKGLSLKPPDTNEDIYQLLAWYTIVNPLSDETKTEMDHIEMGKGRSGNRCFDYLRRFNEDYLTDQTNKLFLNTINQVIDIVKQEPNSYKSGMKSDIPTLIYSLLYIPSFSYQKYHGLLKDILSYKQYEKSYKDAIQKNNLQIAQAQKASKERLNNKYEGSLSDWLKSRAHNPSNKSNMLLRDNIVRKYCLSDLSFIEGEPLETIE